MTYPTYLRDCARRLRIEQQLTLDEIAERLALKRGTVWSWISDLPLDRPRRATAGAALGNAAMQAKYRKLREDAYAQGLAELRDFWGALLDIAPASVAMQRKSNSGQLAGRSWRCEHGVLTVRACDTLLRARLQAWIDRIKDCWG